MALRLIVYPAALVVLGICVYTFLDGSKLFEGLYKNDDLAWYFLAKGIFCSLSLCLSCEALLAIRSLKAGGKGSLESLRS
jgi:hypothetical protein